jgi:hypothetical protein
MPSESERLAARLKAGIEDLEFACAAHADDPKELRRLQAELDAARESLKTLRTPTDPSD